MIDFYALTSPNVQKVFIMLEECGLPYNIKPVDVWAGEQFTHIEITMFSGRSLDVKRALYGAIVKNLEPFGVPPNDVKIILLEVSPSDVGMRGGRASCGLDLGYQIAI